ncbi:MAG: alpha/beta hydrolase [Hyphomicrobiales bacterium]|nr:MAG: alpha/beta hydrolase [Hyphomicrobiales bacterium]
MEDYFLMQISTENEPKKLTVNDVEITYFDSGKQDISDRLPLVMIHGTGGRTDSHFGYLFPLAAQRQRVISIDLAQPKLKSESLSLEHLSAQVMAVVNHVIPDEKITLLGYSLGSVIAASIASAFPKTVENLILIAGWMKTDTHQVMRNQVWKELRKENSEAIKKYMTFCAFSAPFMSNKPIEEMLAAAEMIEINEFVDMQMTLNADIDITEQALDIQATTLVIGCTFDQMVPKHHSKQLYSVIKDARYAEVASGHAVVFERPAELVQLIDNFTQNPQKHEAGEIIPALRP